MRMLIQLSVANMRILSDRYAKICVPCLNCGEYSEQPVEWLRVHDRLFCFACGVPIDLRRPENRVHIERLSKAAAAMPFFTAARLPVTG